ncbi:MobA/MobL family protein [Aureimonas ureilytica]|uniref:MobA/MobL family protein n=1 Tax=Aureimonas ureilytica TaxID=401562 RepID=UPI003CEAADDB
MTSLPAHEALLCTRFGVVQRSRGKSSVAAAAYRAGTRLTDARTGSTWDYGYKKGVLTSYVTAPPGAPAWVHDRAELWSRVELTEKRRDAQTARETQVSIPRDLPPDRWRAFLDDVAAPYVAAGAIVDTAIHIPMASDNEVQPHAHLLVTLRALDPGTETGFAASRNAAVAAFFTSGGRNGEGRRADAMKAERARIADVTNAHLRAAGSVRRADPRSYAARGDPRQPEPKLGEERMAAIRRRRKHDRRSAAVTGMRATRKLENEITKLEMEMALTARGFARAPARQTKAPHQQDYKLSLLYDRFPDAAFGPETAAALYLVDVRDPRRTRVLTRDGAWVEADDESGTVSLWGPRSAAAAALAEAISASTGYGVDTLARTAAAGKPGKSRRKSAMPEAEAITLADRWRRRGFADVTESPAGVRVGLGGRSRLLDSGDHIDLVGPVSDQALRALASKAAEDWGGTLELDGPWPPEAQARLWTECQRQGVELAGYTPPPAVAAAWAAESGSVATTETKLRAVRSETAEADLLLGAAAGDVASLKRLEPSLRAFVSGHCDDDQRRDLARADREEVVASLAEFRSLGATELERQKSERQAGRPSIFDAPPKPADAPARDAAPAFGRRSTSPAD